VLVGNVDSPSRFSYTVMGDALLDAAGSKIAAKPPQKVQVKRRRQEFMV
jgi:hypothetical protein